MHFEHLNDRLDRIEQSRMSDELRIRHLEIEVAKAGVQKPAPARRFAVPSAIGGGLSVGAVAAAFIDWLGRK
jgi:hypothetical protein